MAKILGYSVSLRFANAPAVSVLVDVPGEARTVTINVLDDDARACVSASGALDVAAVARIVEARVLEDGTPAGVADLLTKADTLRKQASDARAELRAVASAQREAKP